MKTIKLGKQGLVVPVVGLGCMGMSKIGDMSIYGQADEKKAIETIHRSLDLGGNFLDTADLYGGGANEQLIAKAVKGNREQYIIASKFGFILDEGGNITGKIRGDKAYVKEAVERSLKNLNTDYIDLYYLHRLDKETPIEETIDAMSELVKEGKIKYIGLSEVGSETIKLAHAIHPLTAVQSEYSLFEREVEELGILATLNDLGIGFVAYSPLGRGFISGDLKHPTDLSADDFRCYLPKFQGDQFYKNIQLLDEVKNCAKEKGITAAQLALAWVMTKGIVPIPGTKQPQYVEQNIQAADHLLTPEELNRLESIIPLGTNTGDRYADMSDVNL